MKFKSLRAITAAVAILSSLPLIAIATLAVPVHAIAADEPNYLPMTRKADAPLTVTPDRGNWTYALGEKASVTIRFNIKPYPAAGVPIKYKLGPEMREGAEIEASVPASGLTLPIASPSEPGFIRCIVNANVEGKPISEVATVGFSPERITPTQTEPADFDKFWADQKAQLDRIPADYQLTPATALSNDKVEVFYLNFQNVGGWSGPSRFYGVLSVPRGEGPFPAVLNVPGAGVRPYKGNVGLAEKGVITLQVGIHGIPVNYPQEIYDQLYKGALVNYNRIHIDDRNSYYYRRVYLGALRASEYLTTLPKWDGKNLVLMGGSQGAQSSIVTSVLNPRVTAVAASYPAYSDVTGYLRGRTGGWPGLFRLDAKGIPGDAPIEAKVLTTTYYDTVNFAKRLKIPGVYFFGYNDATTPPTSTFAAYNSVVAPKKLIIAVEQGHTTSGEQQALIDDWVLKQTGVRK
jgi:cephalosporin-C deacetylase